MKIITLMAVGLLLSGSMSLGMAMDEQLEKMKAAMESMTSEEQEALMRHDLMQTQLLYYKIQSYNTILQNCAARNEEDSDNCKDAKILYDFFVGNLIGPDAEIHSMLSKQMSQKQQRG